MKVLIQSIGVGEEKVRAQYEIELADTMQRKLVHCEV
jgi:hypothetical protein